MTRSRVWDRVSAATALQQPAPATPSAAVEHRKVFSSHLDSIGYDPATQQLQVNYQNGKMSVYEGVPPDVYHRVQGSASIGTALHEHVRNRYNHRYA
jgi:uncharacterized protein YijF (DUF1287 family)